VTDAQYLRDLRIRATEIVTGMYANAPVPVGSARFREILENIDALARYLETGEVS
jgi:hypothetical protein